MHKKEYLIAYLSKIYVDMIKIYGFVFLTF